MSGRMTCGALGAILGLVALIAGVADWTINVQIIPQLENDIDFVYGLADFAWVVWVVAVGSALILIGISAALPIKTAVPGSVTEVPDLPPVREPSGPPPIPSANRTITSTAEESRSAPDLWQSADAPFPAPPDIEHPTEGPDLWQAGKAHFPEVEVNEDAESTKNELSTEEKASGEDKRAAERARWGE